MKYLCIKLVLLSVIVFSSSAYAGGLFAGWETVVSGSNGATTQTIHVSAPTFPDCEQERQSAIDSLVSMGFFFGLSAPTCKPIVVDFPDHLINIEKIRWPWPGPVCLSCPLFVGDFIEVVYPNDVDHVKTLVEKHRIHEYNEKLQSLQKEFDLQNFEAEIFKLELEQRFGTRK